MFAIVAIKIFTPVCYLILLNDRDRDLLKSYERIFQSTTTAKALGVLTLMLI